MFVGCLNDISEKGLNLFTSNYQITENLNQSDLLLVRSFNMLEYDINENLLAVARAGAGVNNIPLDRMADHGVVVFNTPGANANGVKELVIAGMLLSSRDIIGGVQWVQNNRQDENILKSIEKAKKAFSGTEILGKTISVIGLGAVGGMVANACIDLGLKVYGYDPYISEQALKALKPGVEISNDLNKLYKVSDFLSLHLPLLESTKAMFNEDVFSKLKQGAVLLNYSRDQLVDNVAVKNALESGQLKTYVTDFPNHFVANLDHVITLPHLGASTEESEENCAIMAAKQLMAYVEYGDIINSVNYPNVTLGPIHGACRLLVLAKITDDTSNDIDQVLKKVDNHIETSVSKSKNGYAVFAFDFKNSLQDAIVSQIKNISGVVKTRLL